MLTRKNTIALLLAVVAAPAALAQADAIRTDGDFDRTTQAQSGPTRAQSILEARRNGELLVPGELGLTERQLYPQRYPARSQVAGKARAEVLAELDEARRNGDLLLPGDLGITEYQANPSAYPARPVFAGKTREQVRAETLQAIRDGDILGAGEASLPLRQLYPQSYLARDGVAPSPRMARERASGKQAN